MEAQLDEGLFRKPLGDWFTKLIPFFMAQYGKDLFTNLKKRGLDGNKVLPYTDRLFRAFELTTPIDIKCILVGMSPYPNKGKNQQPNADGLLFSNSLSKEESPSLKLFYDAMEEDLNKKVDRCCDLSYLAEQGVLLLNASLTTELGKPDIHNQLGIWDDFNKFFYGGVLESYCGIPIITIGKEAKRIEKHLFEMCHVVRNVEHPAFAARQHREWKHEGIFNWVNRILSENQGIFTKIYWDKGEYERVTGDEKLPWD